jgi:hypothetical protein
VESVARVVTREFGHALQAASRFRKT